MMQYTPFYIMSWMALAVFAILIRENDRLSEEEKQSSYFACLAILVASLAEWCGLKFSGRTDVPLWILKFVKYLDYVFTPIAGGAVVLQLRSRSTWAQLLLALLFGNLIYQTVSVFTGNMLVFDAQHNYSHGPGYIVYILIYLGIIALDILEFLRYGRSYRNQNRLSLYSIMALILLGIVLQETSDGSVRTSYIGLATGLILLFIHYSEFRQLKSDEQLQEQMIRISQDALTGVASRHAYAEALQELSRKDQFPDDLAVFSIDVNGLKRVNDTQGHKAGDELIRGAADTISKVFRNNGTCYRTGGDEFIVIGNASEEECALLLKKLSEAAAGWRGHETDTLSLSAGGVTAAANPRVEIEKLVSLADQEMYKAKSAYYRQSGFDRRRKR